MTAADKGADVRLLLMSDVHLDRGFAWASKHVANRWRVALRDAFARGLAIAEEVDADAVLLGGDLPGRRQRGRR